MNAEPEKWWQTLLAGIGLIGSILVLTALSLVMAPPDERVVYEDEQVTIAVRTSK